MAKDIWIRARISGCRIVNGNFSLEAVCGHHRTTGEIVHASAASLSDLKTLACFAKGMLNSSHNALVQIDGDWAPVGKASIRFDLAHGVGVHKIVNDFSRDGDLEFVKDREDAEKLCLLAQRFPCCPFTLLEIARFNGFDIDRTTVKVLRSLRNAVYGIIHRHEITAARLEIDARSKMLIMAGQA